MTELQKHLEVNPQFQVVYFNEDGGWLFSKHPKYPMVKTREEVLNEEAPVESKTSKKQK